MADLEKFLEKVSAAIKSYGASIRVEGDKLIVEVYGMPSTIRESWISLKRVLEEYKQEAPGRGVSSFSLRLVSREVGLAIPGDVLAAVLKLSGFKAEYSGGSLETTADFEVVVDAAQRVKAALEEARLLHATRTAKKAVVAVAAHLGRPVREVVERGLESGILTEDEDGKLALKRPWQEVLGELVRAVEEGVWGFEDRG